MKSQVKQDEGKLRYDLVPFDALDEVVKVLTFGIKKYPNPEENWRVVSEPKDLKRYEAALLRHMSEHMQGRQYDDETGLLHMAHIATNALFIIALTKKFGMPLKVNPKHEDTSAVSYVYDSPTKDQ